LHVGEVTPAEGASRARVDLRLAGAFGVVLVDRELPPGEVGSRKARTLLKLLAVERRGLLSADRIADVVWAAPDAPPADPGQAVATLVSRLRSVLGPEVIRGGRAGYQLAGEPEVSVDLDAAARYCEHAELRLPVVPAAALAAAGHAAELLAAGTALADEPYAAWADPARAELRALLRRARLTASEAALAAGDPDAAARHAKAATADDPFDEAACRWYMSAAAQAGEPARALLAYAALRDRLSEELGADPAPQTQELHLAILRAQSPSGGTGARAPGGTSDSPAIQRDVPGLPAPGSDLPSFPPALAGRDAEIRLLREAWARAAAGDPSLVVITGEAGIGKTALAAQLEAEAGQDGATVLRTRCYEAEQSLFLQPLVDAVSPAVARMTGAALRDLLGEHAPVLTELLPDAAAVLGPPPSWRGSPEMERRRAFEAVTAFLSGLARRNPVLLVVDDLQYAGKSTVEFTHYLGRHLSSDRLLVVVTVRAEDHELAGAPLAPVATRVELGPLGPAAVAQLAREAGQEALAETILRQTRGHTLFVVEVVRALVAGEAGVPESLRSAVQARVQRIGAAAESLLRACAVLGAAFDPLVLAELLGQAPAAVLDLCAQALQARLLIVSGRDYEFANDLIREVMYVSTPEPTRLAYHRRAADLLTSQPEVLARHASAAGDWPRAGRAWALAAEDAMRRYATSDAIALSAQALGAAERGGDEELRVRALVLRGCAQEAAGAYDAALDDLTRGVAAARAVGDSRLQLRAHRELGRSRPWMVRAGAAAAAAVPGGAPIDYCMANLASGLRIAGSLGDRASEADLLSQLAVVSANRLRLGDALDYGTRAVTAARASGDDQALAAALDGLKIARLNVGDLSGLDGVLSELRPLLRRLGDVFHLQWAEFETAYLYIAPGDLDKAAEAMRAGLEVNRRGGYPHFAAYYIAHLGWLARLRGDDEEAVALGRQAVDIAERHEHAWWQAVTCALLGSTLLLAGDRAAAIALFERGLAAAQDAGAEAYLLHCAARLADAAGSPAVLADADQLLGQAGIPADSAWLLGEDAYLALAQAWLDRGEPERGRAVLAPLLALAERVPWTPTLAATLAADARALIRLGEQERARAQLLRAGQLAAAHGLAHIQQEARQAIRGLDGGLTAARPGTRRPAPRRLTPPAGS
jgi:DNA-binding SARP family transcriptional activator